MSKDFWISPRPKKGEPDFLKAYGLWIFAWHCDYSAPPSPPQIHRYLEFYSISHMYDGHGWFIGEDSPVVEMNAGDVLLLKPSYRNGCGGLNDNYIEDSISFCGPIADFMARSGIIFNGVQHLGKSRRLLPVIELSRNPTRESQYKANMLLQQLLMELFLQRKQAVSEHTQKIEELLNAIKDTPAHWWTVNEMADFCNLSFSQFRRIFKAQTSMCPKEYLLESKVKYAANLLSFSEISIKSIAEAVGFNDPFHFSRVFKKIMKVSPRQYALDLKSKRSNE